MIIIPKKKHGMTKHGHTRNDPYYWLHNKKSKKVMNLIDDCNQETDFYFKENDLQDTLVQEFKDRTFEDDKTIPTKYKQYYYHYEIKKGENYGKLFYKKLKNEKSKCYLNHELLAKKHKHYSIGATVLSYNESKIIYSVDYTGDLKYTLYSKDLQSSKIHQELSFQISDDYVFHKDNQSIFYVKHDKKIRPYQVWYHKLGDSGKNDKLIYEEKDPEYSLGLSVSTDEKYTFIVSSAYENDRWFLINDDLNLTEVIQKKSKHEYSIDHYQNNFYLLSNKDQKINFAIYTSTDLKNWKVFMKHSKYRYIEDIELWYDSMFISCREKGFPKLLLINLETQHKRYLQFPREFYSFGYTMNLNPNYHKFRIVYSSFSQQKIIYEYNLKTHKLSILEEKSLINHNPKNYHEGYFQLPNQLIINYYYHKDLVNFSKGTPYPCYMYGYGSYGVIDDPSFDKYGMSLVNRGYIYCTPQLRGSKFYGPQWYKDGKYLQKKNTFHDFQTAAKYLIENQYTTNQLLAIEGGSAGGLLMAACMNMNPSLYNVAVLRVPFVDCLTTMLNTDLPLTEGEFREWGNPGKYKTYYDYILSYSPYDNIHFEKEYPHVYIETGLNDSQVGYFEIMKYYAKLSENTYFQKNHKQLLVEIRKDSGHSGTSKRYGKMYEEARVIYFILKQNCSVK